VPASTSNLGPGFDCLGLALSIWLQASVIEPAPRSRPHSIARRAGFARQWPEAGDLFRAAFDGAFRRLGGGRGGFLFEVSSEIPLARGLGSSGAAIAAGLLLGRALASRQASDAELLALGIELEGHPDNVTASLAGGLTVCHPDPRGTGEALFVQPRISPSIGLAVAWPDVELSTKRARAVLPRRVALADAVENPRRLALLLAGLERADPALLAAGIDERLHVRHRLPLIPGGAAAIARALESGAWAATISGSGSALVALAPRSRTAEIALHMAEALAEVGGCGTGRAVSIVRGPPRLSYGRA
jgi:homoserine kinase